MERGAFRPAPDRSAEVFALRSRQPRIWIRGAASAIDAVVQVRRTTAGVPRGADITEHIAGMYDVARMKFAVAIEVCVVMPLEPGAEHPHHLAAERVGADAGDNTARRAQHRRTLRRENV